MTIEDAITDSSWKTLIILQRHSSYDNRFPAAGSDGEPTAEEKITLGKLTSEGEQEAQQAALQRVTAIIESSDQPVDFAVLASPTHWVGNPALGQRAIETAQIIVRVIREQVPPGKLVPVTLFGERDGYSEVSELGETHMFGTMTFTNELRAKYGGQGLDFWIAYRDDADKQRRLELKAEGAPDDAARIQRVLQVIEGWAKEYHASNPGKRLAIFAVSHHEVIGAYNKWVLGVQDYPMKAIANDGIAIVLE